MNTFIINMNDTITISDSAMVELAKVISTHQPCVQETGANCNDVLIVGIICIAIIAVAFFAQRTILKWKEKVITATEKERKEKESEESIAQRKQKADAQGKLLDFLKEQVNSYDIQKKEYENAHDNYKDYLESVIKSTKDQKSDKASDKKQSNTSQSEEDLKCFLQDQLVMFAKNEEAYNAACEKYENELRNVINGNNNSDENKTDKTPVAEV